MTNEDQLYLVEKYPEHGFVINYEEAAAIGLNVRQPTSAEASHLDNILLHITSLNAFGRVVEVP